MRSRVSLIALAVVLAVGCGKDSDIFIPNPDDPIPGRVNASVFGLVSDEHGQPVAGADVLLETHITQTNDIGLFLFRDVDISEDAYVRVEKSGYHHGSRRFYPKQDHASQVRIQLLRLDPVGSFQASAGGTVTMVGGARLSFAPDAVVTESGSGYSGIVNVSAKPLYPDNPQLFDQMPGDLVGRNIEGRLRVLATYGMIAVELTDGAGAKLQLANSKRATIELPIAAGLRSSAPPVIPMWYFDEHSGYWKEEGEAIRSGDSYIMEVSHFSFWNCDAPFPLITLTGSVLYDNGEPAAGVTVCLTAPALDVTRSGFTDNEGVFSGKVPKDQELLMTVKDQNGCEILEFEQTIGPFSESTTIPPFTITFSMSQLTEASGTLVDCDMEPVEGGIVQIQYGNATRYVYIDEGNTFSYSFYNCDEGTVTVTAYDYANNKESLPVTLDHADIIDFGTILICEDLAEYLNISADGQAISFALPDIDVYTTGGEQGTAIRGAGVVDSTIYCHIFVDGLTTGTFEIGGISGTFGAQLFLDLGFGDAGRVESGTVTFTYFGDEGDFIMGTMEGIYVEVQWQTQETMSYPFTGEFKILRD